MTIISLHMPKTAGTSFKASLMHYFGSGYLDDYDFPISKPPEARHAEALSKSRSIAESGLGDITCIHGHFLPIKYRAVSAIEPVTFVTWLRDPVMRLLSHYHYWQTSYDPQTSAPHHKRVIDEAWTLEKFCLSEYFKNIYSQYLWCFPLESFSFIGISEYYEEDLRDFSDLYLSSSLQPQCKNVGKRGGSSRELEPDFLDAVREFHAADMELYQRALKYRKDRIASAMSQRVAGSTEAKDMQ